MSSENDLVRALLGALILKPDILENSDIMDQDFPAGRFRETFKAISTLWDDRRPGEIDQLILSEKIGGNGSVSFVSSLIDGQIRLESAAFQGRVVELRKKAIETRIMAKISAQGRGGEFDLPEIRQDLAEYEKLNNATVDVKTALKSGLDLQALNLKTEYLVPGLIPLQSVNVLHASGGMGKTNVALPLGKAISTGGEFFLIPTMKCPVVYIDFENPLALLVDRIRLLHIDDVLFWHQGFEHKPPKLDGNDYGLYKTLPAGSLLIFDTLRSAQGGDDNESKDMSPVMGRLKEIRDAGFTVLVLHHSPRANERASKGSTAITDLADNVIALYRVRQSTHEKIEDDNAPGPGDLLRLGTGQKTRYEPFQMFLQRSKTGTFELASDPDRELIDAIADYLRTSIRPLTQTEIFTWAKDALDIRQKARITSLLSKGGDQWRTWKEGVKRLYESI